MAKMHWAAETTAYRMSRDVKQPMALIYDPTPGGRKHEDGSTSFSLRFPALILSEYVSDPAEIAEKIALELNTFGEVLEALEAITDQLERVGDNRPGKDGHVIDQARAAIAKAKGEEPASQAA